VRIARFVDRSLTAAEAVTLRTLTRELHTGIRESMYVTEARPAASPVRAAGQWRGSPSVFGCKVKCRPGRAWGTGAACDTRLYVQLAHWKQCSVMTLVLVCKE
jgi:hypothetical protein